MRCPHTGEKVHSLKERRAKRFFHTACKKHLCVSNTGTSLHLQTERLSTHSPLERWALGSCSVTVELGVCEPIHCRHDVRGLISIQ